MSLDNFLTEVRERLESTPKLPYKQFPMVIIEYNEEYGPSERSEVMNAYLKLGYSSVTDLLKLIQVVEVLRETLEEIREVDSPWSGDEAKEALQKAEELCR